MSPLTIIMAVLHLRKSDFAGIIKLGNRLVLEGLYVETTLYATPSVSKTDFEAQLKAVIEAVALADKGGDKAERTKQVNLIFKMFRKLLNYVNGLYEDEEVNLKKSGFDVNAVPSPHGVPDQLVIKKIVDHNLPGTIKIKLEPFTGSAANKKERKNYIVQVFAAEDATEYKSVVAGTNSRNIIVEDVPVMTSRWYSIIAVNAAGPSEPSSKVKFTLTD